MKHKWLLVIACAWIMWEADVDPKTMLDKRMNALGGFDSRVECGEGSERQVKMLNSVVSSGLAGGKYRSSQAVGSTWIGTLKDGTVEITRFECWPSDFDPRGK